MKKILALMAAGLLIGVSSLSAQAATVPATATFPVTINLISSCSVNTGGLALVFNYTSLQGTAATAAGSFAVTCTNLAPYTVSLDGNGTSFTGSYVAPAGSYVNTASGLTYTLVLPLLPPTSGTGTAQTWNITGSMAANQSGTCGTLGGCAPFVDTHTLTVTY